MASPATLTSTFTVRPAISVPLADGEDAGPLMDAMLDALDHDARALGAGGVSCDYDRRVLETTFQVELAANGHEIQDANALAIAIANTAIERAGLRARVVGISVVEGDDPDLLP